MKRILVLVLALFACGGPETEEDMARVPPRVTGPVFRSKNQERIQSQFAMAQQDSSYVQPAYFQPRNMGENVSFVNPVLDQFMVVRLKGLTSEMTAKSAYAIGVVVFGSVIEITIALCEYDDSGQRLVLRELSRGTRISDNVFGGRIEVRFSVPVQLSPAKKYAIATHVRDIGTGAGINVAGGTSGVARSAIAFLANSTDTVEFNWDGVDTPTIFFSSVQNFPLVTLDTDSPIDPWY